MAGGRALGQERNQGRLHPEAVRNRVKRKSKGEDGEAKEFADILVGFMPVPVFAWRTPKGETFRSTSRETLLPCWKSPIGSA